MSSETTRFRCGAAWSGPGYDHACGFSTDDAAAAREHWQQHGHWVDDTQSTCSECGNDKHTTDCSHHWSQTVGAP